MAAPTAAFEPKNFISVDDFRVDAVARFTPNARNYYESGANGQHTLKENRSAFDRLRLRPRMLRPVGSVDTACELLGGVKLASPIAIAPTAMQKSTPPEPRAHSFCPPLSAELTMPRPYSVSGLSPTHQWHTTTAKWPARAPPRTSARSSRSPR